MPRAATETDQPRAGRPAGIAAVALMLAALAAAGPARAEDPPNVVLILADDLGYGDVGCYGARLIRTPHIDRLAREGMRFTQAYAPASICSPSRYALMTGRYAWRQPLHPATGVLAPDGPLLLEPGRMTLPTLFRQAGYTTGYFGKWHLGFGTGRSAAYRHDWQAKEIRPGPCDVGFDSFFGLAANVENHPRFFIDGRNFSGADRRAGGLPPPATQWRADRVAAVIADRAVAFIEATAGRPFFLCVATTIPHLPITPAAEVRGRSRCGPYGDFIVELDTHVGRVLAALDDHDILDSTLVLLTSDNGGVVAANERLPALWQARQAGHATCGPLRGRKHGIHEGGFRVPFIVRWPGHVPAGAVNDQLVCLVDMLATCAALLEIPLPAERAGEDSVNLLPLLLGHTDPHRQRVVLTSQHGIQAIRSGRWKFIERRDDLTAGRWFGLLGRSDPDNTDQLYDLRTDPAETTNLVTRHPAIVARLRAELAATRAGGAPPTPEPQP